MTEVQLLSMPRNAMADAYTAEELLEIQECTKLVRFRDEVLSGTHPRIKPVHLTAKSASTDSRSSSSNILTSAVIPPTSQPARTPAAVHGNTLAKDVQARAQTNLQDFSVNVPQPVPGLSTLPALPSGGNAMAASSRPFVHSGNTEINPILLEKSEDLIKAEMNLQRQRLERSLRDELDQRRSAAKASLQASDSVPDFDLADVLSKALVLVQTTSAQPTDDTAANASASSDSFDDNTYYSSRHDTPEFLDSQPHTSEPNKLSEHVEDTEMRDDSPYEPELEEQPSSQVVASNVSQIRIANELDVSSLPTNPPLPANIPTGPRAQRAKNMESRPNIPSRIPGLLAAQQLPSDSSPQDSSAEASHSEGIREVENGQTTQYNRHEVNREGVGDHLHRRASPLIRAHNLSPVAPQPAHVSPLAVARQPSGTQLDHGGRRGTPAQVAALRKQPSAASSPDSSPQGSMPASKKWPRKKRKSDRLAAVESMVAATSPQVKAEPRSPSPMTAPLFNRPNKRSRQDQRRQDGHDENEARYGQPPTGSYDFRGDRVEERHPRHSQWPQQHPQSSEDLRPRQQPPSAIAAEPRYEGGYYESRRQSPPTRYAALDSPRAPFPGQYVSGEVRGVRSVSHAVLDGPYRDGHAPVQVHGARQGRMSVRPAADRERSRSPVLYESRASVMPPPRAPVRRIVVDEFGREYIEPPRHGTVLRPSAFPGARLDEPEVIYERTVPVHAPSQRPEPFEGDELLYGQTALSYPRGPAPYTRRVVTQTELARPDYRAYRERDYIARPGAHPVGDGLGSGVEEGRQVAEAPREYLSRASSVHPAGGGYRYDVPESYPRRIMEEPPREFASARAASVRPADLQRYEMRQGYDRRVVDRGEYAPVPARTGSVRPAETVQYQAARDGGWRLGAVFPERDYAGNVHPEHTRETIHTVGPPDGRAYSVRPVEAVPTAIRHEYRRAAAPADAYYERQVLRGDESGTYLDRMPRQDAFQPGPSHH